MGAGHGIQYGFLSLPLQMRKLRHREVIYMAQGFVIYEEKL